MRKEKKTYYIVVSRFQKPKGKTENRPMTETLSRTRIEAIKKAVASVYKDKGDMTITANARGWDDSMKWKAMKEAKVNRLPSWYVTKVSFWI